MYTPNADEAQWPLAQLQLAVASGTARGRWRVLMQPVYHDFSHEQLAGLHEAAARSRSESLQLSPTEPDLLAQISRVPTELYGIFGREFFQQFFQLVHQATADNPYFQLLARQQRSEALFQQLARQRQDGAEFFTLVLQHELQRLSIHPNDSALTAGLSARLKLALMMVMSPLIQSLPFDLVASWRAYQRRFPLCRWRSVHSLTEVPQLPLSVQNRLLHPDFVREVQTIKTNRRDRVANTIMLTRLNPAYLRQVTGSTLCTAMSFGDMTQRLSVLSQPFSQSVLGGLPVLEMNQLRNLVGNVDGWQMGTCVHPDCTVNKKAGHPVNQLVGPCRICASCQLRIEQQDMHHFGQTEPGTSHRRDLANVARRELDQFKLNFFQVDWLLPSCFAPQLFNQTMPAQVGVDCR